MRPLDTIGFALTSLGGNRGRTVLILLAMSIGVAAEVLLTGFGNGARLYIVDQFFSLGTNLLIVIPGRSETASDTASGMVGETTRDLTLGDAKALRRGDMVHLLAPITWRTECRLARQGTKGSGDRIHRIPAGNTSP